MCFQRFIKFGLVFLGLSFALTSSFASSPTEANATYIYLPKIPKIEATTPVAKKAVKPVKALTVITITPEVESKMKSISQKEYLEYQKLKAKIKKN